MSANRANQSSEPLEGVRAPINYLGKMDEKPYSYNYTPPPGAIQTNRRTEPEIVAVHDARPVATHLSLDREGFAVVHDESAVSNFYDENEIRTLYYPECERLLKEATGAAKVVVFDHIVRNPVRNKAGEKWIKLPAKGAHNDYTLWSGPQRVRDFFPSEADALLKNRFAIINVWRPNSRAVAGFTARGLRRADYPVGRFRRERPALSGSQGRNLRREVQPHPSMVLRAGYATGRGNPAEVLRLGRRWPRTLHRAHRLRRSNDSAERDTA